MTDLVDTVAGFTVPQALLDKHSNEAHTLNCLWDGLDRLSREVAAAEERVNAKLPKGYVHAGFNLPEYEGVNQRVVVSIFHWYAKSVCNLVRLIGWFRCKADPQAEDPPKYVQSVLPEVVPFRDKVSAHFARTTGRRDDSEAERDASVISALSWDDDAFVLPGWTMFKRSSGKTSDSSEIASWSVTRVHKRLCERYGVKPTVATPELHTRENIEKKLRHALATLQQQDAYLLSADVNERSITHRLAMYLQAEFPDWHVDAEYNRDHDKIKSVHLAPESNFSNDTEASTVFPDIIVHRRDTDENFLVIEVKKTGKVGTGKDKQKLEAYTRPKGEGGLGYEHGVHVVLHVGQRDPELQWFAAGQASQVVEFGLPPEA